VPAVAVIVPYRDSPGRMPLLWWTLGRLYAARMRLFDMISADIVLCTDQPDAGGPWCKANAVSSGVTVARGLDAVGDDVLVDVSGDDVLVVHDADCWSDGLAEAIDAVATGRAQWAIPHSDVHRLTPEATAEVLAGKDPDVGMPLVPHHEGGHCRPYRGVPGGGIVVLARDAYEHVPLDPRFLGWGGEDEAWGLALNALLGEPWRGDAPLWHLWHPPQSRLNRHVGSDTSHALLTRYQYAAKDGPEAMRALVDEYRGVTV
jgi:hypothetical protein